MNRLISLICMFIVLVLFANVAQAGFISEVFQPFSTDVSVQQLLRPLFGGLVDAALGSGSEGEPTVLTQVIKFLLTSIVIPFGGLLLLYSMYVGISTAALTAELYGDKKAAYWVALRTVIGFGMVAPAGGLKGLGLINLFLMWLTLSGVGAASSLWTVVVDQVTSKPIILTSSTPDTEVFDAMLRGEMCAAIYNNAVTEAGERDVPQDQLKQWAILRDDSQQAKYGWIKSGGNRKSDGGCGHITIDRSADIGVDSHIPSVSELGSVTAAQFAGAQAKAQMQAQTDDVIGKLQTRAKETAQTMIVSENVIGTDQPAVADYFNLMQWFRSRQQNAAQSIADSGMTEVSSAFKTNAKREGWATAGFYFLGMSTFQQAINQAINMSWVKGTPTNYNRVLSLIADETWHGTVDNEWQMMEGFINAGHQQMAAGQSLPATVTDLGNLGSNGMKAVGTWLNDSVKESIEKSATPLAAAASLGSSLIDYGQATIGGAGAAWVGSKFIPGVIGDYAGKIAWPALLAGAGLVGIGWFLLAVCLLPAFAWARRLLHWAIRVTVAQVAGPMWIILHVHHAGEGLEGNAGNGYRLALGLVLAPVLDITALAIVYALMIVFTPFMNHTLMKAVLDMGSGSFTLIVVFFTLAANVWLVFELLALFEKIEHQVLAFVGGRGSDLSMDNEGSDKNRMMAMMAFVNRKAPMPNFGGGKQDNIGGGDGATLGGAKPPPDKRWANLRGGQKITNDHLLPKDK